MASTTGAPGTGDDEESYDDDDDETGTEGDPYTDDDDDDDCSSLGEDEDEASDDCWADEEDLKDYRTGGYHPVRLGEAFSADRYVVLSKLGWGHFSTVWLAWDGERNVPAVLKLQKSAARYSDAAKDEVELLRTVRQSQDAENRCLVLMHDNFVHRGVNGLHHVMAFEVLGPTLLSLIKQANYQGLPLPVVRRIAACVLVALEHLHERLSIIHTDLKPENVLCVLDEKQVIALVKQAHLEAAAAADEEVVAAAAARAAAQATVTVPATAVAAAASSAAPEKGAVEGAVEANGTAAASSTEALSKSAKRRLKLKEKQKQAKLAAEGAAEAERGEIGSPPPALGSPPPSPPPSPPSPAAWSAEAKPDPRLKSVKPPQFDLDASGLLFKVADLGNSCWFERKFTDDIQTRQYRSPEVILGAGYDASADLWSLACVLFEAATGDLLFSPKAGATWSRDEDHLALMCELLGRMPKKLALAGKHSKEFFTKEGNLRNIKELQMWSLDSVLINKYEVEPTAAASFAAFLAPMLDFHKGRRASAKAMLQQEYIRAEATLASGGTPPTADPAAPAAVATSPSTKAAMAKATTMAARSKPKHKPSAAADAASAASPAAAPPPSKAPGGQPPHTNGAAAPSSPRQDAATQTVVAGLSAPLGGLSDALGGMQLGAAARDAAHDGAGPPAPLVAVKTRGPPRGSKPGEELVAFYLY